MVSASLSLSFLLEWFWVEVVGSIITFNILSCWKLFKLTKKIYKNMIIEPPEQVWNQSDNFINIK